MTDKEIVEKAKEAEKRTGFGELVHSPISKGVNSAFGIGFIEGMVEYRNSLQKEPIILTEEILKKNDFKLYAPPRYKEAFWSKIYEDKEENKYVFCIYMKQRVEHLLTITPLATSDGKGHPDCHLPHPKTVQQLQNSLRLFGIEDIIRV